MTTVADVFDLPERVHQGDFVLRLAEGVERAEQTLSDYVVTPQLARCFDDALSLISSAVGANTGKGAYLHGSFGSGKSHFMAVLTLLLRGDSGARSIPELAGAVAKSNAWTTGRRFLVVPYHSKRNGYHGGVSLQEAVAPVGVYVGPGETLDGWEPAPVSYPPWWFADEPAPAGFPPPAPEREQAEAEVLRDPQRDLFSEAARLRSAGAARWAPLFASEAYAAQRHLAGRGAPDDDTVRAALDALFEARGRLPAASLATRLGVPAPRIRSVIAGLQRLLNVDGYPVLRFSGDTERVVLDGDLYAGQFGPEP